MKSGAVLLRFPESAVSREPTCARHGEHTLADRPDLCGAGAALAAGILASRERLSLWERLKALIRAFQSSAC